MSNLRLIKQKIYEDERVEEFLSLLGCQHIRLERGRYAAALPTGDNRRSVQVRLESSLSSSIRSRGIRGDIFTLVSYIIFESSDFNENLPKAIEWVAAQMGFTELLDSNEEAKPISNKWLKDIKKRRKKMSLEELKPNDVLPEKVKEKYLMLPYVPWIKEGIRWSTQHEWEVGFDHNSQRIITIIRNITGDIIGVKGRALNDDNDYKYLYIEEMNKSIELFGLHKTLPYILEKEEIILFEGYKSVMKAWQMGIRNCASIEGDDISKAQIALIKSLGINVKVVLAYDKDKERDFIEEQASKFVTRKVSYIYEHKLKGIKPLLGAKDAPVDKGEVVWHKLYQSRIQY